MAAEPRFFYHSFPRPRRGETRSELAERGWLTLTAMRELGLILAPEIVEWRTPVSLGTPSPIQVLQRRMCFTELSPQELSDHSERFGPFALEFEIAALRRIGALPVIYMPQALAEQDHLALLGPFIVGHLEQMRSTLALLNQLDEFDDPDWLESQGAQSVADDCVVSLKNGDEEQGTVQEFQVPWTAIRDILSFLEYKRAPFNAMVGAATIAQSLFYPTDNDHHDEILGYYRQREWRVTAEYSVDGDARGRSLKDDEKRLLLDCDDHYWGGNTHPSRSHRRVDDALVLAHPTPSEILAEVTRIVVPDDVVDEARQVFGDRVHPAG